MAGGGGGEGRGGRDMGRARLCTSFTHTQTMLSRLEPHSYMYVGMRAYKEHVADNTRVKLDIWLSLRVSSTAELCPPCSIA